MKNKFNSQKKAGDQKKNDRIDELLEELQKLFLQQQYDVRDRLNRSLPFADYIVDRWKKSQLLGFGEGTSIYDSAVVLGDVKVGMHTWIGPFTVLDGSGGLEIGNYCSISAGVQIYTHDTVKWAISGGSSRFVRRFELGSNCYIKITPSSAKEYQFLYGCIIGANSFVHRDIPSGRKACEL
ncbi:MAG: acyltransferase [Anaerolineales bacterium]|nr:acyltransferase [Anaerolineales bacterium]